MDKLQTMLFGITYGVVLFRCERVLNDNMFVRGELITCEPCKCNKLLKVVIMRYHFVLYLK